MDNKIVYPITMDYASHWDEEDEGWPVIRELVANAMDTDTGFNVYVENDKLHIVSGGVIEPKHLLFGVSEKHNQSAVGQFGEGMKLAIQMCLRNAQTVDIHSGPYAYTAQIEEQFGQQVFSISWTEKPFAMAATTIIITPWYADTYQERFVVPDDERIIYHTSQGDILKEDYPNLYVRGVYVQDMHGFKYGYNLTHIEMNRDRSGVDSNDLEDDLKSLWGEVTDTSLIQELIDGIFLVSSYSTPGEHRCTPYLGENRSLWKDAIQKTLGGTVVKTSSHWAILAESAGAKVCQHHIPYQWEYLVKDVLGTDKGYVDMLPGSGEPSVFLEATQSKHLKKARKLAKTLGITGELISARLYGESTRGVTDGKLYVSETALFSWNTTVAALIKAQAMHEFRASNNSVNMAEVAANVAARAMA